MLRLAALAECLVRRPLLCVPLVQRRAILVSCARTVVRNEMSRRVDATASCAGASRAAPYKDTSHGYTSTYWRWRRWDKSTKGIVFTLADGDQGLREGMEGLPIEPREALPPSISRACRYLDAKIREIRGHGNLEGQGGISADIDISEARGVGGG